MQMGKKKKTGSSSTSWKRRVTTRGVVGRTIMTESAGIGFEMGREPPAVSFLFFLEPHVSPSAANISPKKRAGLVCLAEEVFRVNPTRCCDILRQIKSQLHSATVILHAQQTRCASFPVAVDENKKGITRSAPAAAAAAAAEVAAHILRCQMR